MRFCQHEAGSLVFKYGDEGDLFYIILDGEVAVIVPGPHTLVGYETTRLGFLNWVVENFDSVHWDNMPGRDRIRSYLLTEMYILGVRIRDSDDYFDIEQARRILKKNIEKERTDIHYRIYEIMCPNGTPATNDMGEPFITASKFETRKIFKGGESFGELALLHFEGRAATIKCLKDSSFATLSRKDYLITIGNAERRKLKENVAMLRKFQIFSHKNVKDSNIEKLFQDMELRTYIRGQNIIEQGSNNIDGIFFIVNG